MSTFSSPFMNDDDVMEAWIQRRIPNFLRECILDLMGVTQPDQPTGRNELLAWGENRRMAVNLLHEFFESSTHDIAQRMADELWSNRGKFCLYLRNYSLEAQQSSELAWTEGSPIIANVERTADRGLQEKLAEIMNGQMPFLGLENPANINRCTAIPKLMVDDDWPSVVSSLVAAATVIILHYEHQTEGVVQELITIRKHHRENQTIIVVSSSEEILHSLGEILDLPSGTPEIPGDFLQEFPHKIAHEDTQEFERSLINNVNTILKMAGPTKFLTTGPHPQLKSPPHELLEESELTVVRNLDDTKVLVGQQRFLEAEGLLFVCLAGSFLYELPRIRASVYLELGRLQAGSLTKLEEGLENYHRAVDIYERMKVPEMLTVALQECAAHYTRSGDIEKGRTVLNHAFEIPLESDDPWTSYCLWSTLCVIEYMEANANEAAIAELRAVAAYKRFREQGNEPRTPLAKAISQCADSIESNIHTIPERRQEVILEGLKLSKIDQMAPKLFREFAEYLTRSREGTTLPQSVRGIDERCEVERLLNILNESRIV